MQHPRPLVLLSAAAASFTVVAAAGGLPRGVGPEYASHYQRGAEFGCISDSSVKLSFDRVNDNTCDCPDGSDEPGTAACARIDPLSPQQLLPASGLAPGRAKPALPGFWCENKGHVGSYLPFMYVNDGLCDHDLCCDGSDEYAHVGGVQCENRCAEIGREHRRLAGEKRRQMETAAEQKSKMLAEARELRAQTEARIGQLQAEIAALESGRAELQKKHAAAQLQDKGRVVRSAGATGGKLGVLVGLAKARVDELRDALDRVVRQRNDLQSRVEELETILRNFKQEYNPNFNDEGVKAAVKAYDDYAAREADTVREPVSDSDVDQVLHEDSESSGVNWAEFEAEESSDTDVLYNFEAYLPGFLGRFIHDRVASVKAWLVQNGMLADSAAPGSESPSVKAAREALEAATRELEEKTQLRDRETEDLGKDYGPADIFRAIKGKCVSIDAGEYEYELCHLDKTMQKSKKGHGHTNMGNFARIERQVADDEERPDGKSLGKGERFVLKYQDGQQCWNGPPRSTDVWLGCSDKEELWRVSEAEKCVYKMEVGTPAACDDAEPAGQRGGGKDEL
ncbi:hypothetical protein UVI_02042820 [Ustilaginoidea virens]|uniref:Glucosidase 2 subunit beta n=1 Tax=Ustilaginoidea virens TaxID=1159556 RepID=A0A1B5L3H6_USTVR|nr:hypothetical protein UVI_02042820 [Ustilaginoidea virens]